MVAAFFRFLWLPWQLRGFSVFRFDYAGVIRSFEVTRGDRFESWARVPRLRSLPLAALAPLAACLVEARRCGVPVERVRLEEVYLREGRFWAELFDGDTIPVISCSPEGDVSAIVPRVR